MKFNIYDTNKHCVASDTDSIFIKAEELLKKKFGNDYNNIPQETIVEEVKKISLSFEKKLNNFLNDKTKELLNVKNNRIEFKTETIIKSAYWSGKRRYAQFIVNKEGVPVEELDMKGLDIMKSNFPPIFRDFGEQLIKDILFGVSKEEIDKKVMTFRKSISTINWNKLLKPTGLKKISEYIERKPTSGELFTKLKLKCPVNTKAAIATNDILRFKGLTKKYTEFTIGDKMYIAMLKPNPYQLTVLGLNGYNDAPDIIELVEKYIDREGLFDSIIRNKLETIYADIKWELNLNEHKSKFFSF